MAEKVELHIAFSWVCPECGNNQYANSIAFEMSEEERLEVLEELGMDSDSEGGFCSKPKHVTCKDCDSEFDVEHPEEDPHYDEDWDDTSDDDDIDWDEEEFDE